VKKSMTRVGGAVRKGFKAVQDLELVKLFKSEINFELSSNHFQVLSLIPSLSSIHSQIFQSLQINKSFFFLIATYTFIFMVLECSKRFFR
jgi:hypothetical protein